MTVAINKIAACAAIAWAGAVFSMDNGSIPPANVVQLNASATAEVQQDMLSITLATSREGADAATVQKQLQTALDAALSESKKTASPGQLDVRSGVFRLNPRYNKDNKLSGWQGTAEIVLEGRDFTRITTAASTVQTMTISNIGFGLSREARMAAEAGTQLQAIENFKKRATELAKGFGFTGYTLREVAVNSNDQGVTLMAAMSRDAKSSFSASPITVEPGRSAVTVNVSGSVQLK